MLRSYAEVMDFDLLKKKVNHDYLGEVRSHFHRVPLPSVPHYTDMLRSVSENTAQQHVFTEILEALLHPRSLVNCFHVNGPAGCGKTFVCNALLRHERLHSHVALACATTGVASVNYVHGFTGHALFGFPIERDDTNGVITFYRETEPKMENHMSRPGELCTIISGPKIDSKYLDLLNDGKTNRRLELIRAATLSVWDEISMLRRELLEALDRLLQNLWGTLYRSAEKSLSRLAIFGSCHQ